MLAVRARSFRPIALFLTYLLLVVGLLISPVGAHADAPEPAEAATADTGTEADSVPETATEAAETATREVRWQVRSGAAAVPGTAWTLTDSDGTVRSVTDNAGAAGTRVADTDSADGAFAVAELPVGTHTVVATEVDGFVTPAPTRFEVTEGTGPQTVDAIALTAAQSDSEATEESPSKESDADAQAESAEPTTESMSDSTDAGSESVDSATAAEPATPNPDTSTTRARSSSMAPNAVPNPQPAAQPPLPTTCGLDIAIVLDLSNSLSDADVANSKTAAKGFVSALEGTPSSVGLYTFATFANPSNSLGITSVATADGATTVRNAIDTVQRVPSAQGGTNWDKGFAQVPTGTYDLIVFVTDGNPTAYGTPGTGGNTDFGTGTDDIDVNEGIKSANVHKNAGTFVIGLGVGNVAAQNIGYISGDRQNTDYYLISDYDALSAALKEIALTNCEGTLTVVKQVRGLDGTLRPGAGWAFTSSTDAVSPVNGSTDENGALNYAVSFPGGASSRPVTITETQQDRHRLEQQSGKNAVCTNRSTGQAATVANSGGLGFTVDVPRDGAISCTVINAQYELFEDLTVSDFFAPQFDRDYDWSLVKDVDRTEAEVAAGEEASFDYSVVVTPTEAQDSNFGYRGVATVTNPNDARITGVTVSVEAPGAECTPTRDVPSTIDANGQILAGYTCDFPGATAETAGTHAVTVTWDAEAHHGTTGSAVEETDFDFADARVTVTDAEVAITDDLLGMSETVAAVDGEQRFDYTLGFGGEAGTCTNHTNTAALSTDDGEELSDSETVSVCAPEWELAKTSDPASGSEVQVGDTITYTLTATNRGDATVAEAIVIDDLSSVFDHASLVEGSVEASAGDVAVDGDTLTWTIAALSGTQTVTYQVRVDEDAWGVTLRNAATGDGAVCESTAADEVSTTAASTDTDCPPVTTEHHTPEDPGPTTEPSSTTPATPVTSGDPSPAPGDGGPTGGDSATGGSAAGSLASTGAGAGLLGLLGLGLAAILGGSLLVARRKLGHRSA